MIEHNQELLGHLNGSNWSLVKLDELYGRVIWNTYFGKFTLKGKYLNPKMLEMDTQTENDRKDVQ